MILHPKSNSMPAELPTKLVASEKWNIGAVIITLYENDYKYLLFYCL